MNRLLHRRKLCDLTQMFEKGTNELKKIKKDSWWY